ncbi:MAG: hypothetical protein KAT62_00770 [Desulfuromonadales bacterium]|nr:hypothetical protein [Desulfuromonadales bacterium]
MNLDKYRTERRSARTEQIKVPQLADYFEDAEPLFTLRGLSAAELGRCKEAAQRNRDTAALAGALIGGDSNEKAAALKELAQGSEIPDDICQRIEMLALACVKPELQHSDAVLLGEDFPTEFYQLTNVIMNLTGAGRVLGKPSASGKTQTSEPH